ncbi:MAG: biotin/lipoyl-binding protein [Pseudoxanthomonas sp.]|nr:biotin/lipoyl-binding protein [Pseudoxanthomonas sp.]
MTRPPSPDPAGSAGSHPPAGKVGKKRWLWRGIPGVIALLLILAVWRWWQGPQLEAYAVQSRPLVQTVVAAGRVANVARVQVGSEITGVLVERTVQEGDRVQPGDVLAVLRADDLSAALKQAEAGLAQLQQSGRPQAQAALRQAEAQLSLANREAERRRTLLASQLIARETCELAVEAETVARAAAEKARLFGRPALLLADEPTGNLDSQSAADVFALFRRFNQKYGCAVLLVTHDPRLSSECDRVITLQDGNIVSDERSPAGSQQPAAT